MPVDVDDSQALWTLSAAEHAAVAAKSICHDCAYNPRLAVALTAQKRPRETTGRRLGPRPDGGMKKYHEINIM